MSMLRPCGRALLSNPVKPIAQAQVGAPIGADAATIATAALIGAAVIGFGGIAVYFAGVDRGCTGCRDQDRKWIKEGNVRYIG